VKSKLVFLVSELTFYSNYENMSWDNIFLENHWAIIIGNTSASISLSFYETISVVLGIQLRVIIDMKTNFSPSLKVSQISCKNSS
jgi:hypothetical protein